MGATTVWERWDSLRPDGSVNPGEMTSFNHYALGSVINWLHAVVSGISPMDCGWRKIKVQPIPGGNITAAHGTYETVYGKLDCKWMIQNCDKFCLDLTVPPNSKALVVLPGESNEGSWVGSGTYTFSRPYTAPPWPPTAIHNIMGAPVEDDMA
ncbi:hypothetical protein Aspvir_002900 [Aspergillus viridinutans]|uniref:alpha-L-rhamnosidase n=1 Tax=Aspergillus viridinutans TaxID=75553 RepID=A0A9P3F668_ASPVI|nr:uncharacterized protein Aspvir_002900 [Aspergillus viridinutans]GIK07242.1 hypothetical protein Aspvir_002900 [Aspergillus viridinutans]